MVVLHMSESNNVLIRALRKGLLFYERERERGEQLENEGTQDSAPY